VVRADRAEVSSGVALTPSRLKVVKIATGTAITKR